MFLPSPISHLDKRDLVLLYHEACAQQVEAILHELLLLCGRRVAALVHGNALQEGVNTSGLSNAALDSLIALQEINKGWLRTRFVFCVLALQDTSYVPTYVWYTSIFRVRLDCSWSDL